MVGTASALVDAAREAGTLDDLATATAAAVEQKVENAEALLTLVDLARGQPAAIKPRLAARIDALAKEAEVKPEANPEPDRDPPEQDPRSFPWTDYLLAHAALTQDDPGLLDQGIRLAGLLIESAQKVRICAACSLIFAPTWRRARPGGGRQDARRADRWRPPPSGTPRATATAPYGSQ